jgi:hypothetical protein
MVAPKQRFPLVHWAVLVCSYDGLGSGVCWPCHTRAIAVQPGVTLTRQNNEGGSANPNVSGWPSHGGSNANCRFCFIGTMRTQSRCYDVPMKGNNMTNQNQPGQQNQSPSQKPGQQQGGGRNPGQQSQAPGKGDRNPKEPKEPHEQTSNTDT